MPDQKAAARRRIEENGCPAASMNPHLERTIDLIEAVKMGHAGAADALIHRCLPLLQRWARGRLPEYARDLKETQDVVQEALVDALRNLSRFQQRGEGAFQAYLRQAVGNRIRDEIRRVKRRPAAVELKDQHADSAASPLESCIGRENVERYEAALQRLRPAERELIIARVEMQCSYDEVAVQTGKPSANAARVAIIRAVYRLVEELQHEA
jgi:RNA polymerase sigma factor (sigma-70 family)